MAVKIKADATKKQESKLAHLGSRRHHLVVTIGVLVTRRWPQSQFVQNALLPFGAGDKHGERRRPCDTFGRDSAVVPSPLEWRRREGGRAVPHPRNPTWAREKLLGN